MLVSDPAFAEAINETLAAMKATRASLEAEVARLDGAIGILDALQALAAVPSLRVVS
jgi:hypothetical protein